MTEQSLSLISTKAASSQIHDHKVSRHQDLFEHTHQSHQCSYILKNVTPKSKPETKHPYINKCNHHKNYYKSNINHKLIQQKLTLKHRMKSVI